MTSYFVTYFVKLLTHMVQEGPFIRETLALQARPFAEESKAKQHVLWQ
jgi:hypothetical protein